MRVLGLLWNIVTGRVFLTLLGLAALGVLIWFGGPLLSVGAWAPLVPALNRILAIAGIALLVILWHVWRYWRVRRANRRMVEGLMEADSLASLTETQSRDELEAIRERFEDAMAVLRETTVKGKAGRNFLYELPWYVIIGPPGSGKTTILRNSGLDFPLAERLGGDAVQGVGGTRNCDWWFTNEAVLIDTAGRYTTQDSNSEIDRAAWRGFLDLLKAHRRRRPVNGVLVAISLADILTQDEAERQRHVDAIKKRLQELMRSFGMRLPVYVLFTKADLIAGFTEFFEDLTQAEREQVWGVTFPVEEKGRDAGIAGAFEREHDEVVRRIAGRVVERLHDERDPRRRNLIYAFPEQLAAVKPVLASFLNDIFRPTRYELKPLVRGVYLTSGTQEGTPIDRLMGAFSAAFQLDLDSLPPFSGRGRAYFISHLLRDVVFRESELVGYDRRLELRLAWGHAAGYAAAALLVAAPAAAWWGVYEASESRLARLDEMVRAYEEHAAQARGDQRLPAALPAIRTARQVTELYPEGVILPWVESVGLTTDSRLGGAAARAYERVLQTEFLPRVAIRVRDQLTTAVRTGADAAYVRQTLTTYLMLGTPDRLDPKSVRDWMALDWESLYPLDPARRQELAGYLDTVLASPTSRQAVDDRVITAARTTLTSAPPSAQLYDELKQQAALDPELKDFDAGSIFGGAQDWVFQVADQRGQRYRIPGLYTADGFYGMFLKRLPTLSQDTTESDWVLGEQGRRRSLETNERVTRQVADAYVRDYIRYWQGLLDQIKLAPFQDLPTTLRMLESLASPTSPLRRVLEEVKRNTDLGVLPSGGDATAAAGQAPKPVAQVAQRAAQLGQRATQALGSVTEKSWPGTPIKAHFASLNALVETTGNQAQPPVTALTDGIAGVYSMLYSVATAPDPNAAAFQAAAARMAPPAQGQAAAKDALATLRVQAVTQPAPVKDWVADVAAGGWKVLLDVARQHVNQVWQRDVLPEYQRAIFRRYPVFADSAEETTVKDFSDFFRTGGLLDRFFTQTLKPFVDTRRVPWTSSVVDGQSLGIPPETLEQFRRAQSIRQTLFLDGSQAALVEFTLTPSFLDSKALRVQFEADGERLVYRHEQPRARAMRWPGAVAGRAAVSITDLAGKTQTIEETGPWSLFRLLDRVGVRPTTLADKFRITFEVGDLKAEFDLQAKSVVNPFDSRDLKEFRAHDRL